MNVASYHPVGYALPTTDARDMAQQLLCCDLCGSLISVDTTVAHSTWHESLVLAEDELNARWRALEIEERRLGVALLELGIKVAHKRDM